MNSTFDKSKQFEEICRPILTELVQECQLLRIPFFWSACVKNDDESSEYVNDGVMCGSNNIFLTDDRITKHMYVAAGVDIKTSEDPVEIIYTPNEMGDII